MMFGSIFGGAGTGGGVGYDILYVGDVAVNSDFPLPTQVSVGWMYRSTADVTDNDPTRTNTGLFFPANSEFYWTGITWAYMDTNSIWGDNGTKLYKQNAGRITDLDVADVQLYKIVAKNVNGIRIEDDGGNAAIRVVDGSNVGIGPETEAIDTRLVIQDGNLITVKIRANHYLSTTESRLEFSHYDESPGEDRIARINSYSSGANDVGLKFFTTNATVFNTIPAITIPGDNFVGILNANPTEALDISGNIKIKNLIKSPFVNSALANGASITIVSGVSTKAPIMAWFIVGNNEYWARFRISSNGDRPIDDSSGNISLTGDSGDIRLTFSGDAVSVGNFSGAAKKIIGSVEYA